MQPSKSDQQILMQGMIPWVFMIGGFAGGISLVLASVMGLMVLDDGAPLTKLILFLVVGIVLIKIGLRPRVVARNTTTGETTVAWGLHFPFTYRRIAANDWIGFVMQKQFPVVVTRVGSSVHTSSMPPYYQVSGMTRGKRSIVLVRAKTQDDAEAWRKTFAQSAGIVMKEIRMKVYIADKKDQDPFFKKHRQAQKLYRAIGSSEDWRYVHGANMYDADVPEELSQWNFDISFLASTEQLTKPWKTLQTLFENGYVQFYEKVDEEQLAKLVEQERRLPWVNVDMLARL